MCIAEIIQVVEYKIQAAEQLLKNSLASKEFHKKQCKELDDALGVMQRYHITPPSNFYKDIENMSNSFLTEETNVKKKKEEINNYKITLLTLKELEKEN